MKPFVVFSPFWTVSLGDREVCTGRSSRFVFVQCLALCFLSFSREEEIVNVDAVRQEEV